MDLFVGVDGVDVGADVDVDVVLVVVRAFVDV